LVFDFQEKNIFDFFSSKNPFCGGYVRKHINAHQLALLRSIDGMLGVRWLCGFVLMSPFLISVQITLNVAFGFFSVASCVRSTMPRSMPKGRFRHAATIVTLSH
jgi:hypothetical protein